MLRKPLSIAFLLLIFGVPLGQAGWEWTCGERVQALDVAGSLNGERLRAFEKNLREASFLHRVVSPYYQWACLAIGKGNEKAVFGRDGWIFLRDDLELIAAPGFLSDREWGPVEAAVDLRDQLAERGIELLFVPVPAKSMVLPEKVSVWTRSLEQPANTDGGGFFEALKERGVPTLDLKPTLTGSGEQACYLARDTHWTPQGMALAARRIAVEARELLGDASLSPKRNLKVRERSLECAGDLVGMLRLPAAATPFDPMTLRIEEVIDRETGDFVTFGKDAQVLLLGDSFSGAFSDGRLGLGEHAGLGEHLALELGTDVDVIQIAGGGSRSVRESLARRADGLRGKKLVIWQVSQRELILADGRWERIELPAAELSQAPDPVLPGGLRVLAEVVEVSRVPEEFDYEFCLALYEYRILDVLSGVAPEGPLWVAHVALDGYETLPGGAFEVGDRQVLSLEDVWEHYDLERTSFVDDTDAGRQIWFATERASAD